jgi:hypothetical protein
MIKVSRALSSLSRRIVEWAEDSEATWAAKAASRNKKDREEE